MKSQSKLQLVFTLIGTLMMCGSVYLAVERVDFLREAISANGKVIDLVESRSDGSSTYAPVIAFKTFGGRRFEFKSNTSSNPPSYNIGENVDVLYLPSSPQTAKINGFFSIWGAVIISGVMGSVFFFFGVGITILGIVQGRKDSQLISEGEQVKSIYKGVELNDGLQVNGESPYRIITEWFDPESNKLHVFRSENLWFDPTDYISEDEITVYIDKLKPKRYLVDTSFLPEVVE